MPNPISGDISTVNDRAGQIGNFGSGSWQSALRDEIKLTSPEPDKHVYYALWRKNDRHFEKKLGIFSPPHFQGSLVQDLGVHADIYPLNIYFEGPSHHADAEDFYADAKAFGNWEVVHPVKGPLILQLISVKEIMNPVEAGNYTEFDTEWLEPANPDRSVSLEETVQGTINKAFNCIDDAQILLQQLKVDAYSLVQSSLNAFNQIAGTMNKILKEVASIDTLAKDAYDSAVASYNGFADAFGINNPDPADIGEALTNMSIAVVNSSDDFNMRKTAFSNYADSLISSIPITTTDDDFNKITGIEFGLTLALIMIAQITVTSKFASRSEVVSAMENIMAIFNSVVASIEEAQDRFSALDIDMQYFSQTATYTSLIAVYTAAMEFLIQQFYNLKIEKRFTLKNKRSPLEIAVTEYGSLGENDSNYDLFIKSNNLSGNDILILPAGREVVIYA